MLTLWALGASPDLIISHMKRNTSYVLLPPKFADEATVKSLLDPRSLEKTLGDETYYQDLVFFFEREIATLGIDEVLQKYILGDSDLARTVYPRLYHGYVHAIMHVGLGLEFNQPTILAEGIAEAFVHDESWYTDYFAACQKATDLMRPEGRLSLLEAYEACTKDPVVRGCVDWELAEALTIPSDDWATAFAAMAAQGKEFKIPDEEPWRDRAWGRAGLNIAAITGKYWVREDEDLERAAAEVISTSIYVACAAMLPPHEFRVDFFLIHVSNASYWLQAYLQRPAISPDQKARMIQDTGRLLTFIAAGVGTPELQPAVLESHVPKTNDGKGMDWEGVFAKACRHADDGHMIKFIRALAHGEKACKPYEGQPGFPMRQDLFLKAANAALDNTTAKPMSFLRHFDILRGVGMPEAWRDVPTVEA